jgi:hypothetical protein
MVHLFAHSSGVIAVYGNVQSANVDDVRAAAWSDFRTCFSLILIDQEHSGELSSNIFPIGTAIYQYLGGTSILKHESTNRDHLLLQRPELTRGGVFPLRNATPATTTSAHIPAGVGLSASEMQVSIKGTAYTIPVCQRTHSVTGNTTSVGAYTISAPIRADGMETSGSTLQFRLPKNKISGGKIDLSVTSVTGGSSALYKCIYSIDTDSLGNISITQVLSSGTVVLSAATSSDASYHYVTFTTTNTPGFRIILGEIALNVWSP